MIAAKRYKNSVKRQPQSGYHRMHVKEQRLEMRKAKIKRIKNKCQKQMIGDPTCNWSFKENRSSEQYKYLQIRKTSEILSQCIYLAQEGNVPCQCFSDNFLFSFAFLPVVTSSTLCNCLHSPTCLIIKSSPLNINLDQVPSSSIAVILGLPFISLLCWIPFLNTTYFFLDLLACFDRMYPVENQ